MSETLRLCVPREGESAWRRALSVCLWFCAFSCLGRLRARDTVTTRRLARQVLPALRECDERAPQHGLRPP